MFKLTSASEVRLMQPMAAIVYVIVPGCPEDGVVPPVFLLSTRVAALVPAWHHRAW